MAEGNYTLRMLTTADTGGIEQMDRGVKQLSGNVEQLSRVFEQMFQSGLGAEKVGLGSILQAAPLLAEAWDLGTQIGTAIGDAVTRVGERGFSLDALLGKYDARFDESIQTWREGIRRAMEELGKEPPRTLLDYLNEVEAAAKRASDALEHTAKLEKMRTDANREIENEIAKKDRAAIEGDPNLTPEQKDEALAGMDKDKLLQDAQRRDADRLVKETKALDQEELARQRLAEAEAQVAAQEDRARQAAQLDQQLQNAYTDGGGKGKFTDTERGKAWADAERKRAGVGSFEDENKVLQGMQKERDQAAQAARDARTARENVQDTNAQEAETDWNRVSRQMGDIDQGVADRAQQRRMDSDPAVGQAAQDASNAMVEGAGDTATSLRQIAESTRQGFQQINQAVSELARSQMETRQMAQEALRTAQQAGQAGASTKQAQRYQ